MKKCLYFVLLLSLFSACYVDDGSVPDSPPLPFDNFQEFFAANRAQKDTLSFESAETTILSPSGGNIVTIAPEAFSEEGTLRMAILEASRKSDFILFGLPTVSGDEWLETSEAMFADPLKGIEAIDYDEALSWELDVFPGSDSEEFKVYQWVDGWEEQSSIETSSTPGGVQFTAVPESGYVAAKPIEQDAVELNITATAYGNIPHDMRVFVVTEEGNTVISLDTNIDAVSASGSVPKGTNLKVVVMVMDFYRLDVAIDEININSDTSMELRLDKLEVNELIDLLRELD